MSRVMWKMVFPNTILTLLIFCLLLATGQSGCMSSRQSLTSRLSPRSKPWVLAPTTTREEIVAHINQQRLGLKGWQSTDAEVKLGMLPVTSAMVAVEAPDQFRIRVANPLSGATEVDLGSNQQQVWSYVREVQPPMLHTVSKRDFDQVCDQYGSPIDIDWIMEAMLVKPLDAGQLSLEQQDPTGSSVALVKRSFLCDGRELQQKTIVDRKTGTIEKIILSDGNGEVFAQAELSDYAMAQPGKLFPHKIKLGMPSVPMSKHLSLTLKTVQVNPQHNNDTAFEFPHIPNAQVVQIQHQELQQMAMHLGLVNSAKANSTSTRPVTEYEFNDQGTIAKTEFRSQQTQSGAAPTTSNQFQTASVQNDAPWMNPTQSADLVPANASPVGSGSDIAFNSQSDFEPAPWMNSQNFEPVTLPEHHQSDEPEWVKTATSMARHSVENWQPPINEQPMPVHDPFNMMTPAKSTGTQLDDASQSADPFSPFYQHQSPWGTSPKSQQSSPAAEAEQRSGRSTINWLGS